MAEVSEFELTAQRNVTIREMYPSGLALYEATASEGVSTQRYMFQPYLQPSQRLHRAETNPGQYDPELGGFHPMLIQFECPYALIEHGRTFPSLEAAVTYTKALSGLAGLAQLAQAKRDGMSDDFFSLEEENLQRLVGDYLGTKLPALHGHPLYEELSSALGQGLDGLAALLELHPEVHPYRRPASRG